MLKVQLAGLYLLCGVFISASAQQVMIEGWVKGNNQPLAGATVSVTHGQVMTQTDSTGFFRVNILHRGIFRLQVSYTGFQTYHAELKATDDRHNLGVLVLQPMEDALEEVIVSDNNRLKRIREESLNIAILNRDYIRQNLGGSLMQSLEKLPGIKTIGIGSGNSKPLIRGLGFNQVLVVENGLKHEGQQWGADHGLEIDQYAANQVEVIKGPNSFLYGSDAIAGVIIVTPAPPPARNSFGGTIDLGLKSNNNQWAVSTQIYARKKNWFINGRITLTDYADYRVPADTIYVYSYATALHQNRVRNTAGKERNIHLSTGWIGKNIETSFFASRIYNKAGFFANAHGLEPRRVDAGMHDRSARDIQLPAQEITHYKLINRTLFKFSQHKLEWQTGFQQNFRQEWNNYVNHGYMPAIYPDTLRTPRTLEREYNKTVWNTQLKDTWTIQHHQLSWGAGLEFQKNKIGGWSFLIPAFQQWQAGFFLHDKYAFNNQLSVQAAIRYDYAQVAIQEHSDWFPSLLIQHQDTTQQLLQRSASNNRQFSSFNWSAGLSYEPGPITFKANIGTSFRMPIAKELGANGINYHYFRYEKGDARLSPEQSFQADLGIGVNKTSWSVLLSPYFNYFPNYIYLNPTATHDYFYGAGNQVFEYAQSKVLRYGAELQASYAFHPKWSTDLAAEYLYNEQISGSKSGYTLPFTPPPSFLWSVKFSPALPETFANTYIGVDWRLTGRQNRIVPPERATPAYHVVGLSAGTTFRFNKQELHLSLQIQNLLNKNYLNHTSFYRLIALPEQGRNMVLSVQIPFQNNKQQ